MNGESVKLRGRMEGELSMTPVVRGRVGFISPIMFHFYALEFARAAEDFQMIGDFSPVPYFLYCRSIELSLKAFLLAKGVPVTKFKEKGGIWHNLEGALEEAESQGLLDIVEIPRHYKEELKKANYYYKRKGGFEYFVSYEVFVRWDDLPSLKVLSEFASFLVAKVKKPCDESMRILADKYGRKK